MSFLVEASFGAVDLAARTVHALGGWETKVTVTAMGDIARMVAEIVFGRQEIRRQAVFIGGNTITYGQIADTVERRFGGE